MSKNLSILNEDNKKKNNIKMPLFPKNLVHFGFFTNETECKRGKQDFSNETVFLNATSVLIRISIQKCQGNEFQKILYN